MYTTLFIHGLLLIIASLHAPKSTDTHAPLTLDDLVHRYFLSHDIAQRADIAKQIKQDYNDTPQLVAGAIRHVQLWKQIAQREGLLAWSDRKGKKQTTSYRLPLNYDPARAYPLILGDLPAWLQDTDAFVVASLPTHLPHTFHQPPVMHADLLAMLRELRHRIHLDTARTYLCAPGDVGWLVLLTYPDLFAGAILHGEPMRLPYTAQLYSILLANYRHIPIQWVMPSGKAEQDKAASLLAQYIQVLAHHKNIPLEFTNLGSDQAKLSHQSAKWLASLTQPDMSEPVSHWYRFPSQGRTPWLRAVKYKGTPWTAEQLSIVVNPTVDRDVYITGVLKDRLAYLGGHIQGQSITIETRRCERVVWRLYEHSIDWSKPITVTCNGLRRYQGNIQPSISTMLDAAYISWDFSHPVWASRILTIRSDAPDT